MSKNYQGNHRVMMGLIAATGLLMGTWARATTVVVTADRQAELSTCGCSLDQLGGLARLPSALASKGLRLPGGQAHLWVDAGDLFFTSLGLSPERLVGEKVKADLVAKTYRQWGVDAVGVGPRDFADGAIGLKSIADRHRIRLVSANINDVFGKPLFERYFIIEKNGAKFAVTSVASAKVFEHVPGISVAEPAESLRAVVQEIRLKKPDYLVVLAQMGSEEKEAKLAEEVKADLWVSGASLDEKVMAAGGSGRGMIVRLLPLGQQVAKVDLSHDQKPSVELIKIEQKFSEERRVASEVNRLRKKSSDKGKVETASEKAKGKSFVANYETCRRCHQEQVSFWETTKHASAYLVLFSKNQHFDAECIVCHSVGFRTDPEFSRIAHPLVLSSPQKRGEEPFVEQIMRTVFEEDKNPEPLDSRKSPERYAKLKARYHENLKKLNAEGKIKKLFIGVQCENCHGNRSGHPFDGVKGEKVKETTCRACHKPPNAPEFVSEMVAKVACPLMER